MKEVQKIKTNCEADLDIIPQSGKGIFFKLTALVLLLSISIGLLVYAKTRDLDVNDMVTMAKNKLFNRYSESVGTIRFNSLTNTVIEPFDKGIICAVPEGIKIYNVQGQEEWSYSVNLPSPLIQAEGRYFISADKDSGNIYVFHNKNKIWNKVLEGEILSISINKRGFAGVIYKENGYKSVVKIYNNYGDEVLTRYYSNNYAVSVKISLDDKMIAIGEADISGISLSSGIRFIPVGSKDDAGWFEEKSVLTGMDFIDKDLIVSMVDKIYLVHQDLSKSLINNFGKAKVTNVEISKYVVKVQTTGDFLNSASTVEILNNKGKTVGEFKAGFNIINADINIDKIALNGGNKVVFIGCTGKQIAEFTPKKDVREIKLLKDGTHAAVIYADSLDFVNIY